MNNLPIHDLRALIRAKETCPICSVCSEHPSSDVHHLNEHHFDNTPTNLAPICKLCHNHHHGISDNLTELTLLTRQYSDIQRSRIAMGNRISAYNRLGYAVPQAIEILEEYKALEKDTLKRVAKMLKLEPIYTSYLSKIKGVGPATSGVIISEIGDIGRFESISALWAYCGLDVRDGKAPKRTKGVKSNWNAKLRKTVIGILVPVFVRQKGKADCFGRTYYEQCKAFYVQRDTDKITKLHIENRARRKVGKVFLSCLWVAWRRIKELPITEPYCADKLMHTHIIAPEAWAGDGWDASVQLKL